MPGAWLGCHGTIERAGAEDVEAVPRERVPVAHAEPEVLGHRAIADHAVGVVPAERERVGRLGPFEPDRLDAVEERTS
jgi:hypothetical protein